MDVCCKICFGLVFADDEVTGEIAHLLLCGTVVDVNVPQAVCVISCAIDDWIVAYNVYVCIFIYF